MDELEALFERLECLWIEMNEAWDHEDTQGAIRCLERYKRELEQYLESVKKDGMRVA